VILVCDPKRKPQARGAEGELAAAAAAHEAALLEARHAAEAAAGAAATARAEAGALRAGAGAEREQALAALQGRRVRGFRFPYLFPRALPQGWARVYRL